MHHISPHLYSALVDEMHNTLSCNTEKDRQTRLNLRTAGINVQVCSVQCQLPCTLEGSLLWTTISDGVYLYVCIYVCAYVHVIQALGRGVRVCISI